MKIPEILLVETFHQPGSLASVLSVIADERLAIEHLQSVRREQGRTLWEITVEIDEQASPDFYSKIDALPNARFVGKSDRVFNRHRGGKIHMQPTLQVDDAADPARHLHAGRGARLPRDPRRPGEGGAVHQPPQHGGGRHQRHGDPRPGRHRRRSPACRSWRASPRCSRRWSASPPCRSWSIRAIPHRVIETVTAIATSFGAIQLEDIAAPECFEIEAELVRRLPIPVLHDDQHGTAVVTLAALLNATRRVGRTLATSVIGQVGLGAAGLGIARLLRAQGVQRLLGADLRPEAVARFESLGGTAAALPEVMAQADVVVATTGVRGLIRPEWVRPGQIVFALSNPDAEIEPVVALERGAVFAADGKGINNVAAFPGLFKGALEAAATRFTDGMLVAAAHALARQAGPEDLLPDPLDLQTHRAVTAAVRAAATEPVSNHSLIIVSQRRSYLMTYRAKQDTGVST